MRIEWRRDEELDLSRLVFIIITMIYEVLPNLTAIRAIDFL